MNKVFLTRLVIGICFSGISYGKLLNENDLAMGGAEKKRDQDQERSTQTEPYSKTLVDATLEKCSMGMKNHDIKDDQISASSDVTPSFHGRYGRLDATAKDVYYTGDSYGAWIPTGNDMTKDWLQVDLKTPQLVAGIVTQGRPKQYPYFVRSFKISCGNSVSQLEMIKDECGAEKIFQGNVDPNSKVMNIFPKEMKCRYVRFHPVTKEGGVSLRMELLRGDCVNIEDKNQEKEYTEKVVEATLDKCSMGMKNNGITDAQISASSDVTPSFHGRYGRLDATAKDVYYAGDSYGAWIPRGNDMTKDWLQVDLKTPQLVAGIVTQGRPKHYPHFVTSFKISCGNSVSQLEMIKDKCGAEKIFEGNVDANSKVMNLFPKEMKCRYVRFHPVTWNGGVALRMELLRGDCANQVVTA